MAARAAERAAKLAAMTEAERAEFDAAEQRRSDKTYAAKVEQWRKLDEAYASGQRVVIDLSYGDRMSEKERKSLARQPTPCWGANRIARAPVQMHFTGLGSLIECLPKGGARWSVESSPARWRHHRHLLERGTRVPLARCRGGFTSTARSQERLRHWRLCGRHDPAVRFFGQGGGDRRAGRATASGRACAYGDQQSKAAADRIVVFQILLFARGRSLDVVLKML